MQTPESARAAATALTEAAVLRMANRLGLDASSRAPAFRRQHGAYVAGAIGLALSLGLVQEHRALLLRVACQRLLDAPQRFPNKPGEAPDPEGQP